MGDDGGVTLRIDADTARYIAGIAKAAQANKALHDSTKESAAHMKEITGLAGEFASKVAGWTGPITAASGAFFFLDKATEAWSKKLEHAKDAMSEIADLSSSIIGSGRGQQLEAIRSAIDAGAPGLSGAQKDAFYKSYNAAHPKASVSDIQSAAGSANTIGLLGRDVGSFASLQGSLQRSGVANSGDLANYLQTYAGDSADKAAAMIAKNPGQASQIAELFATGARGGRGPVSLLDRASADYVARGSHGDFSTSLNRRVAGPAGADDLAFLQDPKNKAPGFRAGGLDEAMRMAREDKEVRIRIQTAESREAAQDADYNRAGSTVRKRAITAQTDTLLESKEDAFQSAMMYLPRALINAFQSEESAQKSYDFVKEHAKSLEKIAENTAPKPPPIVAPRFRRLSEGE